MAGINEFELLILKTIINDNIKKFGYLLEHLDFIKIKNIEATGIGLYLHFEYLKDFEEAEFMNGLLSAEHKLKSTSLKNELTYCLDITNGRIEYLEIVTNGNEIWDGNLLNCSLALD